MKYEETKYEEIDYDDKGVLCGYTEEDGWVPLEECCEECGYTKCECEEYCYNMYVCQECGKESEDPDFTECCEGHFVLAESRNNHDEFEVGKCKDCKYYFDEGKKRCYKCDFDFSVYNTEEEEDNDDETY